MLIFVGLKRNIFSIGGFFCGFYFFLISYTIEVQAVLGLGGNKAFFPICSIAVQAAVP